MAFLPGGGQISFVQQKDAVNVGVFYALSSGKRSQAEGARGIITALLQIPDLFPIFNLSSLISPNSTAARPA
jgi:hypothetical protein